MRKPIIAGNWKMNKTIAEAVEFVNEIKGKLNDESVDAVICAPFTILKDLKEVTKRADILIAAIGKAKFVTADYVKEGAVIIDVGMDRDENGKLCGDVDFDSVSQVASAITPVPGGVGPMTVTMLLVNCLRSVELNK